VWVVGADYEDAHKEMEYLVGPENEWLKDLGILDTSHSIMSTHKDQKMIVKTLAPRITFETISGYDVRKIGRDQPDGIIGCEVSRWETEVWNRAYGRLQRRAPRSWGWFSGSFEGNEDWFSEVFEQGMGPNDIELVSVELPSWANRVIYPGGYNDPAIQQLKRQSSESRFMERYGGRPAPATDSVLPEFRKTLHTSPDIAYNPAYPVHLAIDPGTKVYAVLFVQFIGKEIHIVDEVYVNNHSTEQVIRECQMKEAWKGVRATTKHAIDIGGKQKHMGNKRTPHVIWREKTGINLFMGKYMVSDEIDKLRNMLEFNPLSMRPYLLINTDCKGIITEMGGGNVGEGIYGRWKVSKDGLPLPKNDHACKALAYLTLANFGTQKAVGVPNDSESIEPVSYMQAKTAIEGRIF